MKKNTFTVRALAFVMALSAMLVLMTGCNKTPITKEDFLAAAEQQSMISNDATSQFAAYDYIESATVVAPQDISYQIEFYVLTDASYARSFFTNNKTRFENSKSGVDVTTSAQNKGTYAKYESTFSGKYVFLEQVENTVVYVDVSADKKDDVKAFLKLINY